MNLMKYFNYHYMLQNIKKSRSVLILFLVLFPVLNILTILLLNEISSLIAFTLPQISIIHFIGIFCVPIVLSFCLFGFIHKQKSIDFTLSMPISRKTVFTTNTITGIIFILLMIILCGICTYVASFFTPIVIPFQMILDYILIWSITYIFVFIITNIAMSVTGNKSTQIVVTLLLLFLIPYIIDVLYIPEMFDRSLSYQTIAFETIKIESTRYYQIIGKDSVYNYIMPYNLFKSNDLYSLFSLSKMIILSFIGYFIGKFLFVRRKMEVNETSFENLKMHTFVKALTMLPLFVLISGILSQSNKSGLLFVASIVGLIIYYLIYDYLTLHHLPNFKKNALHFVIVLLVMFTISYMINENMNNNKYLYEDLIIDDYDEIENFKIDFVNKEGISDFLYYEITDKESIKTISDIITNAKYSEDYEIFVISVKVDGKEYELSIDMSKEDYQKIKDIVETKGVSKSPLLQGNYVYALRLRELDMDYTTTDSKILDAAKDTIIKDSEMLDYKVCLNTTLLAYRGGKVSTYNINSCKSDVLSKYVEDSIKKEREKVAETIKDNIISNIDLLDGSENVSFINREDFLNKWYNQYEEVNQFILKDAKNDFSINKDYVILDFNNDDRIYRFYTNNYLELFKMIGIEEDEVNYDTY